MEQSFSCFYCGHYFDVVVKRKGKTFALRPQFDHVVPFAHSGNNDRANIVASCHLCNLWKSDRVFDCLEEIQAYLKEKWGQEVVVTDEVTVRIGTCRRRQSETPRDNHDALNNYCYEMQQNS